MELERLINEQREICMNLAIQRRELLEFTEESFKSFIKAAKKQNACDWEFVKRFFNKYKKKFTAFHSLRIICEFICKLFLTFNCEDDKFIMKVIYMYRQLLSEYINCSPCRQCQELNYPLRSHSVDYMQSRAILRQINKVPENTYKFTNVDFYSELTSDVIFNGDFTFLQFLVKYGLSYFPNDVMDSIISEVEQCANISCYLKSLVQENAKENFTDFLLNGLLTFQRTPNLRRTVLVLKAVNISLLKLFEDNYYPDYAKCFNFYCLTLPDPAISSHDVEDFLYLAFPTDRVFRTEVFSSYKEIFPENPSIPSPRSLKHLCRCKVRSCIQKLPTLTMGIARIIIPTNVKDYLLLCD